MDKAMVERRIENEKKEMQERLAKAQTAIQENDFCTARCYLKMAEENASAILTYESILEAMEIWG